VPSAAHALAVSCCKARAAPTVAAKCGRSIRATCPAAASCSATLGSDSQALQASKHRTGTVLSYVLPSVVWPTEVWEPPRASGGI
jgi:hypothetical protein